MRSVSSKSLSSIASKARTSASSRDNPRSQTRCPVTKDIKGKVKLHQAVNLTAAGAFGGGFWGLLVGMLFFNPLIGAAIGAGAGALSGTLTDTGISDDFMRQLGDGFKPGTAALFILIRKMTADKVLDGLSAFRGKGTILKTSHQRH